MEINLLTNKLEMSEKMIKEYQNIIKELNSKIERLEDKLENIAIKSALKPTINNTNTNTITTTNTIATYISNLIPLKEEDIVKEADNLTIEHIKKGAEGYAEFALEFPFKDKLVCVDYARRKIKYKNTNGDLITDPNLVKITPMFFNSIWSKNTEIANKFCNDLIKQQIKASEEQSKIFSDQLYHIVDLKEAMTEASDGIANEFQTDWIRAVCGKLVNNQPI